jgi:hypothetical protein
LVLLSSSPANAREGAGAEHLAGILQKPILRADLYRSLQAITGTNLPEMPVVAALPHPGATRKMRVLVAEDNRTNQLVFQKMVRDIDIDLLFADNGGEGRGAVAKLSARHDFHGYLDARNGWP